MYDFKSILLFVSLMAAISGCFSTVDASLLEGEWKGTEWLIGDQPSSHQATATYFSFQKKTYTYTYGDFSESGKYHVANNELFTTPEGGMRIMVKIVKLTEDSLVMDMNRSGQAERLTLVRK
jgi:hypothetical protein